MELIAIEVACALPHRQLVVALEVPAGTTLREAVERSGLLGEVAEAERPRCGVGVFGAVRAPEEPVRAGDRVEIYRPLAADPKEQRRRRAISSAR